MVWSSSSSLGAQHGGKVQLGKGDLMNSAQISLSSH